MEGFQKNVVYVYNYTILNDYLAGQSIHPLNSANLSLISEVTLPRTVNASPPVAQTRVIFVSSLYYILGTGLFSLSKPRPPAYM